MILFKQVMHAP